MVFDKKMSIWNNRRDMLIPGSLVMFASWRTFMTWSKHLMLGFITPVHSRFGLAFSAVVLIPLFLFLLGLATLPIYCSMSTMLLSLLMMMLYFGTLFSAFIMSLPPKTWAPWVISFALKYPWQQACFSMPLLWCWPLLWSQFLLVHGGCLAIFDYYSPRYFSCCKLYWSIHALPYNLSFFRLSSVFFAMSRALFIVACLSLHLRPLASLPNLIQIGPVVLTLTASLLVMWFSLVKILSLGVLRNNPLFISLAVNLNIERLLSRLLKLLITFSSPSGSQSLFDTLYIAPRW